MATALLERTVDARTEPIQRQQPSANWIARLTVATVMLGIAWRVVRYLMQFPIWGDEAYVSLNFLDRGFWEMTHRLDYNQVAPIGFLWAEWLAFRVMGPSELSLHLFPVLAGIGGLLLFWRFCRLTLPTTAGSLAVGIMAVSYYTVRHATEIKPYSFDLLMTMALLLPTVYWLKFAVPDARLTGVGPKTGWLAVLTLITPLALASSYPAVFIAGGVSLALLPTVWKSRSRAVWGWYLTFNLAMVGTFLAHVKLVGGEQLDVKADRFLHDYWKDWFPSVNLQLPLWLLKAHTGAMMAYPVGGAHGGSTLTLLLCVVGLVGLLRRGRWQLVALLLVPFGLSLVAAFAHRYPYGGSARLAQHLAPAICLLMGYGIWAVMRALARRRESDPKLTLWRETLGAACILGLFMIIAGCGLVWNIYRPFKMPGDEQIRRLLQDVSRKAQPTDTIVVYQHPDALRANMVWYLRLTGLPIVWQGKADWPALAEGQHGVWGFSVRGTEGGKPPADERLSALSLIEQREQMFEADSKDVPRQWCQVFHWVPASAK